MNSDTNPALRSSMHDSEQENATVMTVRCETTTLSDENVFAARDQRVILRLKLGEALLMQLHSRPLYRKLDFSFQSNLKFELQSTGQAYHESIVESCLELRGIFGRTCGFQDSRSESDDFMFSSAFPITEDQLLAITSCVEKLAVAAHCFRETGPTIRLDDAMFMMTLQTFFQRLAATFQSLRETPAVAIENFIERLSADLRSSTILKKVSEAGLPLSYDNLAEYLKSTAASKRSQRRL